MNKSIESKSFNEKIKLVCIGFISIWATSPFMAYGNIYRILVLFAMLVWLSAELSGPSSVLRRPTSYILALYIYLIYTIPINLFFSGMESLVSNIQLYVIFFFILVYASYERRSLKLLRPIVNLQIVLMTLWLITTFIGLTEHPRAARELIRSSSTAVSYANSGIGGFGFINSLLVYCSVMISLLVHEYRIKKLINTKVVLYFITVLLSIVVIVKANYSITLLLLIMSLLLLLLIKNNNKKYNIYILLVVILFIILMQNYVTDIINILLPYAEGTNYHLKLRDMLESSNSSEFSGTAFDRIERYIRSINLIVDNPILGTYTRDSVGKHSLILDTFAQFGFFVGILLMYILFKIPYNLYIIHKKNLSLSLTILFVIFALSSLNNVAMSYGFFFYLFYPYVIRRI